MPFSSQALRGRWDPLVGPVFARRIARSLVPLQVLIFTIPASWISGIAREFTVGWSRNLLGALNSTFALTLFVCITAWLILQARIRMSIENRFVTASLPVRSKPQVLSVTRYSAWLRGQGIDVQRSRSALTYEEAPFRWDAEYSD